MCLYLYIIHIICIYTEMLFLSGCSDHHIGPSEATVWILLLVFLGSHPPPAHVFQDFSSQHPYTFAILCFEVWNLTQKKGMN